MSRIHSNGQDAETQPGSASGRRSRRRRVLRALASMAAAALLAAVALSGLAAWQNTYDLREEHVVIRTGGRALHAVLALPDHGRGPYGVVVFVHGDGPVDATHDTFYRPMWEAFAKAGYASLSWNKPGVGGSPGNWLHQSMADRAAETADAIAWARTRPDLDSHRIGLWGASQAGWVLPKVAATTPGIRFVITISPAVNWLRQGRYNTLAELADRNATPAERDAALARREAGLAVLRRGGTYADYCAAVPTDGTMTADRYHFISRNWTSDATADLGAAADRGIPTLLVLAGHDRNVDAAETEAVYRRELPPRSLRVEHYAQADHGMADLEVVGSDTRALLTAVFAPRSLYTPGYLNSLRAFTERFNP
ncbi:alpha/beta hydrolase family protein [Streptomyces virginiae]|uniref:alpha/beta hydrolase family protein n=1 Tax=Streptomyces virginiae TaxID=1961 RepID=UPI0036A647C2